MFRKLRGQSRNIRIRRQLALVECQSVGSANAEIEATVQENNVFHLLKSMFLVLPC